ncbi:MAG: hypothetical protein JWN44_7122 [Myxococcales bacterium]|nr:hypothetical protein [Myxococcales bacterium]
MRLVASRLRLVLAALALALGLTTACYTPSVPLPPPLVENMTFADGPAAGSVILKSPPQPAIGQARFSIYNVSQKTGVILESATDGSFTTAPFPGTDGDYVQIYYEDMAGGNAAQLCTTLHVAAALVGAACH